MVGLKLGLCLAMLMLPLALGGCAGALVVGGLAGVAGGGYAAAQERGIGGAVSDLEIETNVESAFAAIDPGLKDGITHDRVPRQGIADRHGTDTSNENARRRGR